VEAPADLATVMRLGRGVVVAAGAEAPPAWSGAPRVLIDDETVRAPADTLALLHRHWSQREPVVLELRCNVDELRAPQSSSVPAYTLNPQFELTRERLYFLARANNYDNRAGALVWGPGVEATRLGASPSNVADIALGDGTPAWCDGGPRAACPPVPAGHVLVHRNTIEQRALTPDGRAEPATGLAPDQLDAVRHDAGPARVIAPAGSGKTRVLTARFTLLLDRDWDPRSITAVAYNVRAKDTMQARVAEQYRDRIRTLHALGNQVLQRGRGNSTLIDEWDVRRRIESLVPVRPRANTDVYAPYIEALAAVRLGLVDPNIVEAQRDDVAGFAAMFDEYREKLAADGAIDFDEQIYGAIETLLRVPDIRRPMQRSCRHLLVDEFQDLTPAQLLLLRLLAAPAYDVFGVGDDDQVIYGYAGADPDFLINHDRFFPGGSHHALAVNYRCPPAVVDAARNLLSYNRRRIDKQIVAAKSTDDTITMLSVARTPAERIGVAAIEQATKWFDAGAQPGDVAVLSRVNATLLPVQILLGEAGVPCWTPVSSAVLQRTGTRTALAYLRLACAAAAGSPFSGGDIAVAARRPSRSIRREILQRFERRRHWRLGQLRDAAASMNTSATERFELFLDELGAIGGAIDAGATTAELLVRIRDDIGLGSALATLDGSGKGPDASHRDDLNALIAVATFEPDPIAFEPWLRERLRAPADAPSSEGVAVSTVHRVKGMEWPFVVVVGAHDGLMPHVLADDLEEERRIFHVAITRADAATHVVAQAGVPAPFVDEMATPAPADYVPPVRRVASAERATPARPAGDAPPAVVAALKAWRKQRATSDRVPAYVVLSDAHLEGIATSGPRSLAELARCAGIGPTKLERYGDEIVAVIADLGTS